MAQARGADVLIHEAQMEQLADEVTAGRIADSNHSAENLDDTRI
jgi:ribonuclease BN (tRNA processing enzyme)